MAIKASDFSVTSVQVIAFTPDRTLLTPSKVLATVMSQFSEELNGDVQVLPIPSEAPDELPRLELKSEDKRKSFTWSPGRTAFKSTPTDRMVSARSASECWQVMIHLFEKNRAVTVNRLAFIVHRTASKPNAASELVDHFCKLDQCAADSPTAPLRNSKAFQVHNLKKYSSPLPGVKLNSWVRCKADSEAAGGKIAFEQDLNTPIDDSRRFAVEQIREFYEMAGSEADKILSQYFPE